MHWRYFSAKKSLADAASCKGNKSLPVKKRLVKQPCFQIDAVGRL